VVIAELKRIVLAEDNAHDVDMTITALRAHNVLNEIVVVRDGADALDYLFKREGHRHRPGGNPAMLLLDLTMPKVDGLEVLRQVRADPALKTIPVVVLTSSREEREVAPTQELGVNACVVKPIDFHAFIEAVKLTGSSWALINEPPLPGGPRT
jgi:CheY-like chemotaxis protein